MNFRMKKMDSKQFLFTDYHWAFSCDVSDRHRGVSG